MRRCEAKTVRGTRCRREAVEYRNVRISGEVREVLVCSEHAHAIYTGAFRGTARAAAASNHEGE